MRYAGNPKHKEPWQPGRRGSLCPTDLNLETVQKLLEDSVPSDNKRYATWRGQAFAGQGHDDTWHGYPVGWREVPQAIRNRWRRQRLIDRANIKKHWIS